MPRVSIFYDKDEKEQFFKVRGDEGYVHTTKTELTVGTATEHNLNFDLEVTVNVFRDDGEGSIVIYDNDSPIYIIDDWSSDEDSRTVTLLELNYEINHRFYAHYMGNNYGNASKSNSVDYLLHNTQIGTPTLTMDNTVQFNAHTLNVAKTITLSNTVNPTFNYDQDISVYYDDVLIDTVNTETGNTVSVTIADVGGKGLHTLKAVYTGSNNLSSITVSQGISVGYTINVVSYPSLIVNGESYTYSAKVTDWLNNNIEGVTVNLIGHYGTNVIELGSVTSNSLGVATFTPSTVQVDKISVNSFIDNIRYTTDKIDVTWVSPSLTVNSSSARLYKDETNVLSFDTGQSYENIPIHLSGYLNETIYTNNMGKAIKTIIGEGKGTKTILASCGTLSHTISLDDYAQYWLPNDIHNQNYYLLHGTVYNLNNYFRINLESGTSSNVGVSTVTPSINIFGIGDFVNEEDYELIISGVSSSKNCSIRYIPNMDITDGRITSLNLDTTPSYASHSNETWRVVRSSNTVTVYKNGTIIDSYDNQGTYEPLFMLMNNNLSSINITFTQLTLKGGV